MKVFLKNKFSLFFHCYIFLDLGYFYLGNSGAVLVKISIIIINLGGCISYVALIGDFISKKNKKKLLKIIEK